jgi:hypothetical protein
MEESISINSSELNKTGVIKSMDNVVVATPKVNPPKLFVRNCYGLLENDNINYIFNEDGSINWRAMVKTQYLVPNRQRTQETDVSKLEDKDLLILLGGIKELAQIRGFTSVEYKVVTAADNYFATSCRITWVPNYETENRPVVFEALADASLVNTKDFARYFLAAIAENRAFVRCVRNFLKINIVSQEELGDAKLGLVAKEDSEKENPMNPTALLEKVMQDKGISFEVLKKKLIKEKLEKSEDFSCVKDIPKSKVFELIERLKKV